jgi:hypothetical protein
VTSEDPSLLAEGSGTEDDERTRECFVPRLPGYDTAMSTPRHVAALGPMTLPNALDLLAEGRDQVDGRILENGLMQCPECATEQRPRPGRRIELRPDPGTGDLRGIVIAATCSGCGRRLVIVCRTDEDAPDSHRRLHRRLATTSVEDTTPTPGQVERPSMRD